MPEPSPNHEILTTQEAAAYLRVSQYTIWRWCKSGRLPAFQINREWRIRREKLDALIEELEAEIQEGR
ncbi:MAG: helix-turn-helix domain-containing protein [Anaerolineae bacterium]